ncbi:prolipoprotein diacylglyceryl transferase [Paenibacillus sp. WLX1005]|uniref:prolipoprotein diacylglyceryl transferase n=1 Tax=Paenibacillus sp. WLX1005 TaxID=3243766 RepID=UPI00398439B5
MGTLLINPIAFSIGSLEVHWYGLILGFGALMGLLFAIREGKRFGIPQEFFMDLLLFGVPSAIIAARIYYVAFRWPDYKNNFVDVFKIWNGGIAIYGALIGAIICAVIYTRYKGYNFWRIADICAPSLLIGQLIGRWGNFVNQEAYGGPVDESFLRSNLHLPDFIVNQMNVNGIYHHPTFLYESVWNIVGVLLLCTLRRRPFVRAGEIFMSYFIWYGIGRFFIEALRTDSLTFDGPAWLVSFVNGLWSPMTLFGFQQGAIEPGYGNIRISQLLSLVLIIVAILLIIIRRRTGMSSARYSDPIISTKHGHEFASDTDAARAGTAAAPTAGEPHKPLPADEQERAHSERKE